MYTRCTHCDTVFRVTPQQLQASSGKVRCGRCHEVFDAFSSLSAQPPAAAMAGRAAEPSRAEPPSPPPQPQRGEPWAPAPAPAPHEALMDAFAVADEEPEPRSTEPPLADEPEAFEPGPAPTGTRTPEPELTLPDELFGKGGSRRASWPWALASLLLVVVAAAQAAWVFASQIAQRAPALRPALETFCGRAGCAVALPRLPDALFIEASDLQLLDAQRPDEILLTLTIRNRAAMAQAFPLLELTLTGAANQVTSRKVFRPHEYLDPAIDRARGIGANQEVSIRLYLSTGALRAAGYRLYLFFA